MNLALAYWLAAGGDLDILNKTSGGMLAKSNTFALKEILIILGAVLVLALILVLVFVFIRKGGHRRRHHRRRHHWRHHTRSTEAPAAATAPVRSNGEPGAQAEEEEEEEEKEEAQGDHHHHRRRVRRREHRSRNPTLAETGGLPPIRSPEAPPPAI